MSEDSAQSPRDESFVELGLMQGIRGSEGHTAEGSGLLW